MMLSHFRRPRPTLTKCMFSTRQVTPLPSFLSNRSPVFHYSGSNLNQRVVSPFAIESGVKELEEEEEDVEEINMIEGELPEGLQRELMPKHVAVIMDGNGRWATQRNLPRWSGHAAGARALKKLVNCCSRLGIRMEIEFLMGLLQRKLEEELNNFIKNGIKVSFIGDSSKLPDSIQKLMAKCEEATKNNIKLQLIFALSYSGKYDIMQACQSIAHKVKDGLIEPQDIDETLINRQLQTYSAELPCPDLLIRTSGELRVSNFLLWQLAYTELFFAEALWPDFGEGNCWRLFTLSSKDSDAMAGANMHAFT